MFQRVAVAALVNEEVKSVADKKYVYRLFFVIKIAKR